MFRAPKDHMNKRILENMISGIPATLGLGTRNKIEYGTLSKYLLPITPRYSL